MILSILLTLSCNGFVEWNRCLALLLFTDGSSRNANGFADWKHWLGLSIFTDESTDETDSIVNRFPGFKGLTDVKQLISLNPESTGEFSTKANGRNHGTVAKSGIDFEWKIMQNSKVQSHKQRYITTEPRYPWSLSLFSAATSVTPQSSVKTWC